MHLPQARLTGRTVVRLTDSVTELLADLVRAGAEYADLSEAIDDLMDRFDQPLDALREAVSQLRSTPIITAVPQDRLVALEDEATDGMLPLRHRLLAYWVLDTMAMEGRPSLVNELNAMTGVDFAYSEVNLEDPVVDYMQNPLYPEQSYLEQAPDGIDAEAAWDLGFSGVGVGFVDIELGWNLQHVDLRSLLTDAIAEQGTAADDERALRFFNDNFRSKFGDSCSHKHGTNVLGVVVGIDNTCGVVGIAPDARVGVASRFKAENDGSPAEPQPVKAGSNPDYWQVPNAIVAAVAGAHARSIGAGDVLLLEVQTVSKEPVEVVPQAFDAIRLAVALGVVVIEAAGNGGTDLDGPLTGSYELSTDPSATVLDRGSAGFTDSGAIMVASADPGTAVIGVDGKGSFEGHAPHAKSNYGSRIDCYAWGESVMTCDYHTGGGGSSLVFEKACGDVPNASACDTRYTFDFGGTSAASAIVAGAAILVQEMTGKKLSPLRLRQVLSGKSRQQADALQRPDTGTGYVQTLDAKGKVKQIGVMPDLLKIAGFDLVQAAPDVYVRDSYDDTGDVPTTAVFASPDIVVRNVTPAQVAAYDPFAAEAADATSPVANDLVQPNADNHVFVRVHNRSPVAAPNTTVHVYWSEVATLLTSDQWHEILPPATNAPVVIDVPGNGSAIAAVQWDATNQQDRPASGHGCFIAVLDHADDPAPFLIDWDQVAFGSDEFSTLFKNWVANANNVAWRNFLVADGTDAIAQVVWFLRGAPDRARNFDVVIEPQFPEGVELYWEVPRGLLEPLTRSGVCAATGATPFRKKGERERREPAEGEEPADEREFTEERAVLLLPNAITHLREIRLRRSAAHACRFAVRVTKKGLRLGGEANLMVRQFHDGDEVGRITWRIAPRRSDTKRRR